MIYSVNRSTSRRDRVTFISGPNPPQALFVKISQQVEMYRTTTASLEENLDSEPPNQHSMAGACCGLGMLQEYRKVELQDAFSQ